MEKAELVFVAYPGMGLITQIVEFAKLLAYRPHRRLSITVLLMKLPIDPAGAGFIDSLAAASATDEIHFHHLPLPPEKISSQWNSKSRGIYINQLVEYQKIHVRNMVAKIVTQTTRQLAGFVVDMLCSTMIDVAEELGVPSYVFSTSGAGFLGLMLHLQALQDEHNQDIIQLTNSSSDLVAPFYTTPIPSGASPSVFVDLELWNTRFLPCARRHKRAKGIVINTFAELESDALGFLSSDLGIPRIYPVGPIFTQAKVGDESLLLMKWLDDQPLSSVVFLCFGSMGSYGVEQVREIALGLEESGYRFVWVLRRPPPREKKVEFPDEFVHHEDALPDGFLDRTAAVGKVVGWAPQLSILSHPAVGGFVSHCGWNSILESVWCGVPIATWPLYAEQQLNAFQIVRELGLAVEITLDYNDEKDDQELISSTKILKGIRDVMMEGGDDHNGVRKKLIEMKEKSMMSIREGGPSYTSVESFLKDVIDNMPLRCVI